jgi:hypothetical protein
MKSSTLFMAEAAKFVKIPKRAKTKAALMAQVVLAELAKVADRRLDVQPNWKQAEHLCRAGTVRAQAQRSPRRDPYESGTSHHHSARQ